MRDVSFRLYSTLKSDIKLRDYKEGKDIFEEIHPGGYAPINNTKQDIKDVTMFDPSLKTIGKA